MLRVILPDPQGNTPATYHHVNPFIKHFFACNIILNRAFFFILAKTALTCIRVLILMDWEKAVYHEIGWP